MSRIDEQARLEILRRLRAIESEQGVQILLAVESGSRAWGFASQDSDYDVRFIYVRPRNWYLSIDSDTRRDVIECPIEGDWDINGWDLRKALQLFRKSNPPLLEWLQSPIVYVEQTTAASELRSLVTDFYSPRSCRYHNLHMARRNYRVYLQSDDVWVKKYFYVLRPLLACRWIAADRGAVPMEFEKLLDVADLPDSVAQAIQKLLAEKRQGFELGKGPAIPEISQFLSEEFQRLESEQKPAPESHIDTEALNELFRRNLSVGPPLDRSRSTP